MLKHSISTIAFFLLMSTYSLASYDLFPIPEGSGGSVRMKNMFFTANEDAEDDDDDCAGRHSIDVRYFFSNFELSAQLSGVHWDAFHYNQNMYGALDIAFGVRYQLHPNFNILMDLDGIPIGADNVNIRYIKFGMQASAPVTNHLFFGSEIGFRNPFERELQGYDPDYDLSSLSVDQGGILNISGEIDYKIHKTILFLYMNYEVQINDSEIKAEHYGETFKAEDGAGDVLFEIIFGANFSGGGMFSLETNTGFRTGELRTLSYAPQYVVIMEINLKWDF